nr:probable serine/threonine protein kinase IRE [Ipomoea batatas]
MNDIRINFISFSSLINFILNDGPSYQIISLKLMDITICAWDILLVKQGHGARRSFPYSMTISKVIIALHLCHFMVKKSRDKCCAMKVYTCDSESVLAEYIAFPTAKAKTYYLDFDISKLLDIARSVANVNNDYSTLKYLLDRLEDLKYVIQDRKIDALVVETFGRRIEKLLHTADEESSAEDDTIRSVRASPINICSKDRTSIEDFEIIKPIRRGAFGRVFLAKKRAIGDLFAIKVKTICDFEKPKHVLMFSWNTFKLLLSNCNYCVLIIYIIVLKCDLKYCVSVDIKFDGNFSVDDKR